MQFWEGMTFELEAVALGHRRVRGAGAGVDHVAGCPADDRPFDIRSKHGTLASIPYGVELNDIPMMLIRRNSGGTRS